LKIAFTLHSAPTENRALNWAYRILKTPQEFFEKGDNFSFELNMDSRTDTKSWKWQYKREK